MAERKAGSRISHAEIKAGVFLTFCLALFIAMLFVLGKFGHNWRGRQELHVAFTRVSGVRPDSIVRYNGMEIGRVKHVKIVRAEEKFLSRLAPFTRRELSNLPLTELEAELLRNLPQKDNDPEFDKAVRERIAGRTMVLLMLDVLSEADMQRFHQDDEFRIDASLMGENAVDIRTGNGTPLVSVPNMVYLGVSGDMYTDLGKSIGQVKDILESMAEMVGGEESKEALRGQLTNFENFTERLEKTAGEYDTKMPKAWNVAEERIASTRKSLNEVQERVEKLKPKFDEALVNANSSIQDAHDDLVKSLCSVEFKIKEFRQESFEQHQDVHESVAKYRDSIPEQVKAGREWSEQYAPTIDTIDNTLARADSQLSKGIDSTRAMLAEYVEKAGDLEATTYKMKKWPDAMSGAKNDEVAANQDALWRHDLAARNFLELRAELSRIREELSSQKDAGPGRVAKVEQLLREIDQLMTRSEVAPPPKKGRK